MSSVLNGIGSLLIGLLAYGLVSLNHGPDWAAVGFLFVSQQLSFIGLTILNQLDKLSS